MPRPRTSTAFPPLYLLRAGETCPACRQGTNAYTLLAAALWDAAEEDRFPGPLVLKDIRSLPRRLLALLGNRCPGWRFDQENPGRPPYLMNHCRRCGAQVSDDYLHAEPGSAFFPTRPEECRNISLFTVPATGPVPIVCSWTAGGLTDFLEYGEARPLSAL